MYAHQTTEIQREYVGEHHWHPQVVNLVRRVLVAARGGQVGDRVVIPHRLVMKLPIINIVVYRGHDDQTPKC